MEFNVDHRTASLSVGDFADFSLGPRESEGGPQGLWRAQLGSHWHKHLRKQLEQQAPDARFEIPVQGSLFHRGWLVSLNGRIDQLRPDNNGFLELRELKTVLRTLPADEAELRADYESYFVQACAYQRILETDTEAFVRLQEALGSSAPALPSVLRSTLVFIEPDTGLAQSLSITGADLDFFNARLDRLVDFLEQRRLARQRLRELHIAPPFQVYRSGQEDSVAALFSSLKDSRAPLLFEAPTGFGKTGVILEVAARALKEGLVDRLLYLTGKATGQLQVATTVARMTSSPDTDPVPSVSTWLVRPKSEHCVAPLFHCSRDVCRYLNGIQRRWASAGLSRHFLDPHTPRDLASLRRSGEEAVICPYEITRAALPFCDIWIGDFNYVFSPASSSLFLNQPGFDASRTLLVIDEAHNLPSRAADCFSHRLSFDEAQEVLDGLYRVHAHSSVLRPWDHWTSFLRHLPACTALSLDQEDDARDLITQLSSALSTVSLDYTNLGPRLSSLLWGLAELASLLKEFPRLPRHWWAPRESQLHVTCLDASEPVGLRLSDFRGVLLASATFGPPEDYAASVGLNRIQESITAAPASCLDNQPPGLQAGKLGSLNKRDTKRLLAKVTTGAELLRVDQSIGSLSFRHLPAAAPWRHDAYQVAIDLRVDTRLESRERSTPTTAQTIRWLCEHTPATSAESSAPLAVFFPSFAYADSLLSALASQSPSLKIAFQPKGLDLAAQTAWIEDALVSANAIFLILGSSFAESIDILGGRIHTAMVVGPALPEVNPIQQARLASLSRQGRPNAFRLVYQVPGMQKVNQALGRLVRDPAHKARVLLHCRRFGDDQYARLLSSEYHSAQRISTDLDLLQWLASS